MPTLALYQPDIAANLGTIFRTAACLDVPVAIIEPCGFPFDDRKFRRAGMDYIDQVDYTRYASWDEFRQWQCSLVDSRLILLSSKSTTSYIDYIFQHNDVLLLGRETAGVPDHVVEQVDDQITIPMQKNMRSLNVAIAGTMVLGEALRQIR